MDWDKAKKIVIMMLLLLNAALFSLNRISHQQYIVSQAEEKAIFQVLGKNTIGMYTSIIREFEPMRLLHVQAAEVEMEKLRKIFFSEEEPVQLTVEFNHTILKSGTKTLRVSGNGFDFACPDGWGGQGYYQMEQAEAAAKAVLSQIGGNFSAFQLYSSKQTESGFAFSYFENYKGNKIFNNYSTVQVSEAGITSLSASCYEIEGFFGNKMDICSSDEALYTFMREAVYAQGRSNIFVEKLELGYDFQEETEVEEGRVMKLIPCYHITVSGDDTPYIVNAYTNELISAPDSGAK